MVFRINDNISSFSDEDFAKALPEVSEQRRMKALRFRHKAGQKQSLLAYLCLMSLLNDNYGITEPPVFEEEENGKPHIKGHENVHFNMSHCMKGVACAVSDSPVGIDIERIPALLKDDLCAYVFNEYEQNLVKNAENPCVEFTRLWTMKEAFVKLTGTGISGREQLQPLLNDYWADKEAANVVFVTKIDVKGEWVTTVAEWRKPLS